METCSVCFATVDSQALREHLRFHKLHDHHQIFCSSLVKPMAPDYPPNPCTCPMMSVSPWG